MTRLLDTLSRSIEENHNAVERRISALINREPSPITGHASPVPPRGRVLPATPSPRQPQELAERGPPSRARPRATSGSRATSARAPTATSGAATGSTACARSSSGGGNPLRLPSVKALGGRGGHNYRHAPLTAVTQATRAERHPRRAGAPPKFQACASSSRAWC